ncbi:MAG: zinc-binding dehydrogenase, partial [Acidimicrobiia bacterium]|nr:zinc-binding dehydrogenase [Acidimicrobiia bacterium]
FAKALAMSPFVRQRLRPLFSRRNQEDLEVLREFLDAGKVLPVIDGVYDLPDVPEALRYVEAGHARGKVAINI